MSVCGRVLHACGVRAVCASVCVWNALSECVMLLVCRPGVSMKILKWIGCDEGETCGPGVGIKILKTPRWRGGDPGGRQETEKSLISREGRV